jgi:hypothetical protein
MPSVQPNDDQESLAARRKGRSTFGWTLNGAAFSFVEGTIE